ncbi:MAG: murein biosynthesis integral membrane protein MurJ [Phycisphaerae bacterium]
MDSTNPKPARSVSHVAPLRPSLGPMRAPSTNAQTPPAAITPPNQGTEVGGGGGKEKFVRHANLMSVLTVISRVFGLVREKAFSIYLGNLTLDGGAFLMGFLLPNLFRRIFGEGALTAIFVPVYTRILAKEGPEQANRLASATATLLVVVLGLVTILGEALLIPLVLYANISDGNRIAAVMIAIMLPYCVLVCLVALMSAMASVHERFTAQSISPIILNVFMIAAAVVPVWLWTTGYPLRQRIYWMAGAVLVAGVIQVMQMLPTLWRSGIQLRWLLTTRDTGIQEIVRTMLPMIVGLSAVQLNTLMDSQIAWWLSPAGHNNLTEFMVWGWKFHTPMESGAWGVVSVAQRLYMLPVGIFGVSLATAIFPRMSRAATQKDTVELKRLLVSGLGKTLFLSIPASVGMILLARPLITVIFNADGLDRATHTANWFCAGIWAFEAQMVILRLFYAVSDRLTPMKVAVSMVGLNFSLNVILVWFMKEAGIAFSTTFCAALQCVILLMILRRKMGHLGLGQLVRPLFKGLFACGVMALAAVAALGVLHRFGVPLEVKSLARGLGHVAVGGVGGGRPVELAWVALVTLPVVVVTAAGTYMLMAWILEMPEVFDVPLLGRWLKRLQPKA